MHVHTPRLMFALSALVANVVLPVMSWTSSQDGRVIVVGGGSQRIAAPRVAKQLQAVSEGFEADGTDDQKTHDGIGCWCEKYTKEGDQTLAELRQQLAALSTDIESQSAAHAQLAIDLDGHQGELADSQKALGTAKALRQQNAEQFASDEQTHVQSINTLDSAMNALGQSHGVNLALNAVRSMVHLRVRGNIAKGALLQMSNQLRGKSSPDSSVVYGVIKQMKSTFSSDLVSMRKDEASAVATHDGLEAAKQREIDLIKKQVIEKNVRATSIQQNLLRKEKQKTTTEKLLSVQIELVPATNTFCEASSQRFQARQEERQGALVALASAQVDLAGAEFLSFGSLGSGAGTKALCDLAAETASYKWSGQVKDACQHAQAGRFQDAADAANNLQDDLESEKQGLAQKREQCTAAVQDKHAEVAEAADEVSAKATFVHGTKEEAESEMSSISAMATSSQEAKAKLAEALAAERQFLQQLHASSAHVMNVLRQTATVTNNAGPKIKEVLKSAGTLGQLAEQAIASQDDSKKVVALLDDVARATAKVLIPLRLMHADAEEAAISVHDEEKKSADAAKAPVRLDGGQSCDLAALDADAQKLGQYAKGFGDAASSLEFESLR